MKGNDDLSLFWSGRPALEFRAEEPARSASRTRLRQKEHEVKPDERLLLQRLAAGDHGAMTQIANWLWEPLAAYAYRIVEDRDLALDIAQEALIRLWEGRRKTLPTALAPFLYRVARNLALDHLRTSNTRQRLLRGQATLGGRRPATPEEEFEDARVSRRVHRAIQALPERRREVFVLAYLRGLTYAEIGEVMGMAPEAVQNQMAAARAQLRDALRRLSEERRQSRTNPFRGDR